MQAARNGIGLIALTLGIIACSDATQPTSPEPAPYEGAKVSMTGTSTISIPGLNGQVVSATTHEWATEAIVTNGLAAAAQSPTIQDPSASKMPVLYISANHVLARGPRNRQILPGKDSKGNGGEFVIIHGDAGPVKTMAHIGANRQIDQAYSFEWKKVNGGWLATAFTVSLFKNGKPVVQIRSASKFAAPRGVSPMLAADDPCWDDPNCEPADYSGGGSGGGAGGSLGGGWYDTPDCCQYQLNLYLIAASALAGAYELCKDSGTLATAGCILTLASLGGAVTYALIAYNQCYQTSPCAKTYVCPTCYTSNGFFKVTDPFRPSVVPA
jgi:hypothetical protein